jgi:hypothetical protein
VGGVLANEHLSREFKQKLLWENPARFYNLKLEIAAEKTPRAVSAIRA